MSDTFYKDKSIFDGVWNFESPIGEIRIEHRYHDIFECFLLNKGAYIFQGNFQWNGKVSDNLEKIYDHLIAKNILEV